jgi:late competence protein required for DNA uptake (superfamily II DNA/RNA helicase)
MGIERNPLDQLLNSSMSIDHFIEWHKLEPITQEQRNKWEQNHSQCHRCYLWQKDSDFSSFTLGMVLCKDCDK